MGLRYRLTTVGIVAALALSGVTPVLAQQTDGEPTRTTIVDSEPTTTTLADDAGAESDARHRPDCAIPDVYRFPFLRSYLNTAAEVIGIPTTELVRLLAEGESIASVARANGVDPTVVVAALAAPLHRKIDSLVDKGCIRPAYGERLKAHVTARFTAFVEKPGGPLGGDECERPDLYRQPTLRGMLKGAAHAIGIDVLELVRNLHSGKSIAEVARQNGFDPGEVVAALTATAADELAALVEAGCLRHDAAAAILREVTARVEAFVWHKGLGSGIGRSTEPQ